MKITWVLHAALFHCVDIWKKVNRSWPQKGHVLCMRITCAKCKKNNGKQLKVIQFIFRTGPSPPVTIISPFSSKICALSVINRYMMILAGLL